MITNHSSGFRRGQGRPLRWMVALGFTIGCQAVPPPDMSPPPLHPSSEDADGVIQAEIAQGAASQGAAPQGTAPQSAVQAVVFTDGDRGQPGRLAETQPESLQEVLKVAQTEPPEAVAAIDLDRQRLDFEPAASMTAAEFESLALSNNPTIAEMVATTQKAAGFRTQVSLRANPSLGYNGTQLADRGTDQHTVFVSQTVVTGDKLALNRNVLNEALRAQLLQLEAQKYRVVTDVRIKFFEALAAQRRVELIREFQSVSNKGLEFAELRKQAQEGSQLEVVQAKVLKNEIDLQLQQAEIRYAAAWRELAALAGVPELAPTDLQGELPNDRSPLDWTAVAATIVVSSPEYQAAQTRVRQARANLCRQGVQPIPNLELQFASGYDNATDNGLINVQIGAPIPIFNRNQGNIAAARAEYVRASREVERIENAIKARLAAAAGDFDASLAAVTKYANDILPNAQEGLELAEIAYRAGETSYVQVLVAQRSYFETNLQYIAAQALLGQASARVDGFVLTGALDPIIDHSGDDSLRGLTFSQQ